MASVFEKLSKDAIRRNHSAYRGRGLRQLQSNGADRQTNQHEMARKKRRKSQFIILTEILINYAGSEEGVFLAGRARLDRSGAVSEACQGGEFIFQLSKSGRARFCKQNRRIKSQKWKIM